MLYDLARRLFGYRKCRVVSGNPSSLISRVPSHAVELSSSELTLRRSLRTVSVRHGGRATADEDGHYCFAVPL